LWKLTARRAASCNKVKRPDHAAETRKTMKVLDDGNHASGPAARSGRAGQDRPVQLLVIDDVAVHRMIISKLATKAGFVPIEAESCGDVVRLTTLQHFDCATLDLSLGERAGTEVLRHFSICGFRSPIIILSGADAEVATDAFELGQSLDLNMLQPIGKPVDLAQLREKLKTIAADALNSRRPVPA
jgi:CheY-like chemotaxis protein